MKTLEELLKMSVEELTAYSNTLTLRQRVEIAHSIAEHLSTLVISMFPEAAQHLTDGDLCSDAKSKEIADTFIHKLLNQ